MMSVLLCIPPVHSICFQSLQVIHALKAKGHRVTVAIVSQFSGIFASENIDLLKIEVKEFDVRKADLCIYRVYAAIGIVAEQIFDRMMEKIATTKFDCVLYYSSAPVGYFLARLKGVPAFSISPFTQITSASWKNFKIAPCCKFWSDPLKNLACIWVYYGASFKLFKKTGYHLPKFYDVSTGNGDLQFAVWLRSLSPQPVSKKVIFIGSDIVSQSWPAGVDLSWMTGNCVYISAGTIAEIPIQKVKLWIDLLANKPYKVLIKVSSNVLELISELPTNIRLSAFVNQIEVLKRTSVFVTHGGCNSILEAINFGVPLITRHEGIIDQFFNAEQIANAGAGLSFSKEDFDENLVGAIDRLLNDPSFKENVQKVQQLNKLAGGMTKLLESIEAYMGL